MNEFDLTQPVKQLTLVAKVIRANGTEEELGTIAYWHKNSLHRLWHRIRNGKTGSIRRF